MKKELLLICTAPESCRVKPGEKPVVSRFFRHTRLSLLSVAGATPSDWEVSIVDEYVKPIDLSARPTCVGLSFMTAGAPRAYEIARQFRSSGIPVLAGGYHPTFLPEEALRHCDAVCIGDAEPSWPRMLHDLEQGSLKRIYRSDPQASLSGLPLPRRDLLDPREYLTRNSVQTSRGCPHRCTFCSITSFYETNYRHRPVDEVLREITALSGKIIIFIDDNLVVDRTYALQLFKGLKSLNKHWFSQAELTIAQDPELLEAAVESGCRGLFVGLESLSDENLKKVDKRFCRVEEYFESIDKLHKAGVVVEAGIVFGFNEDGPEVFSRTLDFLIESRIELAQITPLTPFPGTPLFNQIQREGRLLTMDWRYYDLYHTVFQPMKMSPEELQSGTDYVVERFYSTKAISKRALASLRFRGLFQTLYPVILLNLAAKRRIETWEERPSMRENGLHWLSAATAIETPFGDANHAVT
ncbi:MAG: B12-binding domain-containing radical SAM protein [Fidelibacterota bacterium]|nr:MAG: B12-binding domain-containing radical SAM protein [Candidatus Neomarinimicrobiota bacterium]